MHDPLDLFHPLIQRWFRQKYFRPTDIQTRSWQRISQGEHLLVTAPTGSGKTLTAFLWGINRFATQDFTPGYPGILYISPLKALNNDISRNLLQPISELRSFFEANGKTFPAINVATRSGDTEPAERQRMLRHPPEILITTPESLNLMLSSAGGQSILQGVDTLILDEIHSIAGNKRGTYLMSGVERLVCLSGEFQRIALSATVRPPERVAALVGGYQLDDSRSDFISRPRYLARSVGIIETSFRKSYEIGIRSPESARNLSADNGLWDELAIDFRDRIKSNQSTLVFTNSRSLCEKLTFKINSAAEEPVAYAHHGSLSKEVRLDVERHLKAGELSAIVATSSLELGIDVGSLDEVLLVQSPLSISSTVQKIGRAGHQVAASSRATIYPTHATDFIEAAVLADAVLNGDIEPVSPIENALDVLAQVIVSMVGTRNWDLDELYARLKTSYAYHNLPRPLFDLVINMLAGRYADTRIRELKPKIAIDRLDNQISARKGALQALYFSGGVIPNRGYYQLRHEQNNARIGELDEEFVWEARIGKAFTFGTGHWQITRITHNDVFVRPAGKSDTAPPFWKSEGLNRDYHFSEKIGRFLESFEDNPQAMQHALTRTYCMDEASAETLTRFIERQREHTGSPLPHRHHLLFEQVKSAHGSGGSHQLVIHTTWGGRVNRPFAIAMEAAWDEAFAETIDVFVTNDALVMQLPREIDPERLLSLVEVERLEELLKSRLESSGFFGARFRECAGRALLISRGRFGERKPLWMSRLQSQKLLNAVMKYDDFPILLESWRSCLVDEFDLNALRQLLGELKSGSIQWSLTVSHLPSPMARTLAFDQINQYMYMDDTLKGSRQSAANSDLIRELLARELPEFQWRNTFSALRLMELSGEVLSGYFFEEVTGPQFIDPAAFRLFQSNWCADDVYWLSAIDPISPAGLDIRNLKSSAPRRIAGNHLVYHGRDVVLVSEAQGRRLTINCSPTDENLPEYCVSLKHLLHRSFQPLKQITVESINSEPAISSAYIEALEVAFEVTRDHRTLALRRRYH